MYIEGAAHRSPTVRIVQSSSRSFTGYLTDPDEGLQTFGPYPTLDEVTAVMSDYLAAAVREARLNILSLVK